MDEKAYICPNCKKEQKFILMREKVDVVKECWFDKVEKCWRYGKTYKVDEHFENWLCPECMKEIPEEIIKSLEEEKLIL
ncbi:MAG: hypothetical protein QW841_04780 [Candidatus Aenigmatarchaeota archaeon]